MVRVLSTTTRMLDCWCEHCRRNRNSDRSSCKTNPKTKNSVCLFLHESELIPGRQFWRIKNRILEKVGTDAETLVKAVGLSDKENPFIHIFLLHNYLITNPHLLDQTVIFKCLRGYQSSWFGYRLDEPEVARLINFLGPQLVSFGLK